MCCGVACDRSSLLAPSWAPGWEIKTTFDNSKLVLVICELPCVAEEWGDRWIVVGNPKSSMSSESSDLL